MTKLTSILAGFFCLSLAASGCTKALDCKDGTIFVHLIWAPEALDADTLDVAVSIDGGPPRDTPLSRPEGKDFSTIEIDFSQYPKGANVQVTAVAKKAGAVVGTLSGSVKLDKGCGVLQLQSGASEQPDLSGMFGDDGGQALDPGASCTTSTQCASGNCVDGVCCESACTEACKACNLPGSSGKCTNLEFGATPTHGSCDKQDPSSCGRDGTCNGAGECQLYPLGSDCSAGSCNATTNEYTPPSQCDGAGTCKPLAKQSCAPFTCKPDGSTCLDKCAANGDCTSPNTCNVTTMSCGTLPNGRSCTSDTQCTSGHCVDQVCCNTACAGQCQACDIADASGLLGTCTTVGSAQSPAQPHGGRTACKTGACGGVCDGTSADQCTYQPASKVCGSACTAASTVSENFCDGAGTCSTTAVPRTCPNNLQCSAGTCPAGCTSNSQCSSGYYCKGTQCVPLVATDGACVADSDCDTGYCYQSKCTWVSLSWVAIPGFTVTKAGYIVAPVAGATLYPDGRVFALQHGTNQNGARAYSIATRSTADLATMPYTGSSVVADTDGKRFWVYGSQGNQFFGFDGSNWSTTLSSMGANGYFSCAGKSTTAYCMQEGTDTTNATLYSIPIGGSPATALATLSNSTDWNAPVVVGTDGRVYTLAGDLFGGGADFRSPDISAYVFAANQWTRIAYMSSRRAYSCVAAGSDGRIYAAGGLASEDATGPHFTETAEAYSPTLNRWTPITSLPTPNSTCAATTGADGRIYGLVGGAFNSSGTQFQLFAYGPEVTLSTTTATKGAMVTISGAGFGQTARVTISFDGQPLATASTDNFGGLAATKITVPNVTSGGHKIVVVDNRSGYPITLYLTVQ